MYLTSVFFFSKHCSNNIWNTFLDPFEQETFQALAYHHHPQNLQAVQLQHVFNSWAYWLWETFLLLIYSIFQVKKCPTNSFLFLTQTTYSSSKMIHLVEIFNISCWSLFFIQCSFLSGRAILRRHQLFVGFSSRCRPITYWEWSDTVT